MRPQQYLCATEKARFFCLLTSLLVYRDKSVTGKWSRCAHNGRVYFSFRFGLFVCRWRESEILEMFMHRIVRFGNIELMII